MGLTDGLGGNRFPLNSKSMAASEMHSNRRCPVASRDIGANIVHRARARHDDYRPRVALYRAGDGLEARAGGGERAVYVVVRMSRRDEESLKLRGRKEDAAT
jgi:hypothetical protein